MNKEIDFSNLEELKGKFLIDESVVNGAVLFCYDADSKSVFTYSNYWDEEFYCLEDKDEISEFEIMDDLDGASQFAKQHFGLSFEEIRRKYVSDDPDVLEDFNDMFGKLRSVLE